MYKFEFTTITPLHISNGETLDQSFHYTIFNNELYRIDHSKFSKLIAAKENIDFRTDITTKTIENWVRKHQIEIVDKASAYSVKVHPTFKSHLENPKAQGRRQVIEFINSNGKFYIPASSVKGALLTPYGLLSLGINPQNPKIEDKVVFYDSEELGADNFSVYRTESRPPENNLICLDPDVTFYLIMAKKGLFDKEKFISKLKSYTKKQLENLNREVSKFKSKKLGKIRKADLFLSSIQNINTLAEKGEIIINIGFGGGSWFKIKDGSIPMFKSKLPGKKHLEEPAHSSFAFTINKELVHIGWCKLKIVEE